MLHEYVFGLVLNIKNNSKFILMFTYAFGFTFDESISEALYHISFVNKVTPNESCKMRHV